MKLSERLLALLEDEFHQPGCDSQAPGNSWKNCGCRARELDDVLREAAAKLAQKPIGYIAPHELLKLADGYCCTVYRFPGEKRITPLYALQPSGEPASVEPTFASRAEERRYRFNKAAAEPVIVAEDGFGNAYTCYHGFPKGECKLEIVHPGKVQCECLQRPAAEPSKMLHRSHFCACEDYEPAEGATPDVGHVLAAKKLWPLCHDEPAFVKLVAPLLAIKHEYDNAPVVDCATAEDVAALRAKLEAAERERDVAVRRRDELAQSNWRECAEQAEQRNAELVEALTELLLSVTAEFPPASSGQEAQDAWANRRAAAIKRALDLSALGEQPR